MRKWTVLSFFFLTSSLFWAQNKKELSEEKLISHTVTTGETVLGISKHYGVDPSLIYRTNSFALDSIKQGMVLTFPISKITANSVEKAVVLQEVESFKPPERVLILDAEEEQRVLISNSEIVNYKVQSGETLYGLSKKFVCTVDELKSLNPQLATKGLQSGQVLKVPIQKGTLVENTDVKAIKTGQTIEHIVQPNETLYGLSKRYGISVANIQKQNKLVLVNGLQVNQTLLLTIN